MSVRNANEMTLHKWFTDFARDSLSPQFYPEGCSVGRIKEAIYAFFEKRLGMDYEVRFADIINMVLSKDNRMHFTAVIEAAKFAYIEETKKREGKLANDVWDIPEWLPFGDKYEENKEIKKSVMMPFYSQKEGWQSETAFIEHLEAAQGSVAWWFKNGGQDTTGTFFAVPYGPVKNQSPFYIDFVVKMKDGRIGLFDPHGLFLADCGEKSDGLREYIARLNKGEHKAFGGILANTEPRTFKGRWMLYEGEGKDIREGEWNGWVRLEL